MRRFHGGSPGLFQLHPDLRYLFPPAMEEQYRKLDEAILVLLSVNFRPGVRLTPLDATINTHSAYHLRHEHLDAFRDAFLRALGEVDASDEYSQDAWRAILDPALAYMRSRVIAATKPICPCKDALERCREIHEAILRR